MSRNSLAAAVFAATCLILPAWGASSPAIIDAARYDDSPAVTALLAQHADVNARAEDGMTALAWAAMRSNLEIAGALLKAKANPDLANVNGVTPLSLAILNGSPAMVDLLLEHRANPNVARDNGESPLMTLRTASGFAGALRTCNQTMDQASCTYRSNPSSGRVQCSFCTPIDLTPLIGALRE